MNEITEKVIYEEPNYDSTEALLEQYEDGKNRRLDDVIATQAVVCVLAAAALFTLNFFRPDMAESLFQQLKHCMNDTSFVLPDPIECIIAYLQKQ